MWALLRPTVWVMLEYWSFMGSMVMLVIVVLRRESLSDLDTVFCSSNVCWVLSKLEFVHTLSGQVIAGLAARAVA
jgi:hypothetical protein